MKPVEETQEFFSVCIEDLVAAAAIEKFELYQQLTNYGQKLEAFPEDERIEKNFVYGCISNVYIHAYEKDGRIFFQGSSDALTTRGYVYILVHAFSGLSIQDFLDISGKEVEHFATATQISSFLTPSRANAIANIYVLMKKQAQDLLAQYLLAGKEG